MLASRLLSPKVTLVKAVQPENAEFSMFVTLFPMVTLFKPVQTENAHSPIPVTLLGRETLLRYLSP